MNGPDTAPLFVMSKSSHGDAQPLGTVVENSQSKTLNTAAAVAELSLDSAWALRG